MIFYTDECAYHYHNAYARLGFSIIRRKNMYQASAIANSIKHVFPANHPRLCLWHVYQNAAKNLSNVFSQFQTFSKDFKGCVYDPERKDEFQERWDQLHGKYGLHDDKWLQNLYQLKEKWAQAYGRTHFCAGMTTTQRSESINKFLKHLFCWKSNS